MLGFPNRQQLTKCNLDPRDWSKEDVKAWLTLTSQQSFIPMDILNLDSWNMDGAGLVSMTENDFKNRLPNKHGENLFTQFDIWRTNYTYDQGFNSCHGYQANMAPVVPRTCSQESQAFNVPPPPYPDTFWSPPEINQPGGDTFEDFAYMIQVVKRFVCNYSNKLKTKPLKYYTILEYLFNDIHR